MLVIFPIHNRIKLLPYFLQYYTSIGASRFVCCLYDGEKSPLYEEILSFRTKYDLSVRKTMDANAASYNAACEAHALNKIRLELASKFGWYCVADLDEFHYFDGDPLPEVIRIAQRCGYGAVHGIFFDRIAADGSLPEIKGKLDRKFPLACDLSFCSGMCNRKITVAKSNVVITAGHHNAKTRVWTFGAEVHHFKWCKGVVESIKDRYVRYVKQGKDWAKINLPRQLKLVEGGIDTSNPKLNVRVAAKLGV